MKRIPRVLYAIFTYASLAFIIWVVGYIAAYNVNRWIHRGDPTPTIRPAPTLGPIARAATRTATATSTLPPTATSLPSPTATPAVQPTLSQPPALALIPKDELGKEATYHNVILFSSLDDLPLRGSDLKAGNRPHTLDEGLWMLKLDTLSAAPLTPPGLSSAVSLSPQGLPRLVNFGAPLPTTAIQSITPPSECVPPPGWNGKEDTFFTCVNFRFSSDGNFMGYKTLTSGCGGDLGLFDLRTKAHASWSIKDRGQMLDPLPNGRWLFATGTCGSGKYSTYDPLTKEGSDLGPAAMDLIWNPQRSAFYAHVFDEGGHAGPLWGYNMETSKVFLMMDSLDEQYNGSPTWTPDGKALIFQHRQGTVSADRKKVHFNTPRQLISVDITTRSQSPVIDPAGDLTILGWAGDFLMVGRYPFKAQSFDNKTLHFSNPDPLPQPMDCVALGENCGTAPDLFGYDYRTRKLVPWSQTGLPAAIPTLNYRMPALDLAHPLYEDPGGAFKVVLGPPMPVSQHSTEEWQGFASLWYVPHVGGPLLWVETGRGFVFVP